MGWWGSKLVHRHHQWIAFYFIGYNVRSEIWFACRMPVLSCSQFTVVRSRSLLKKMSNTRRFERHCSQQISKSLLFWCFPTCSHQVPHARENVAEISSLVIVLSISASTVALRHDLLWSWYLQKSSERSWGIRVEGRKRTQPCRRWRGPCWDLLLLQHCSHGRRCTEHMRVYNVCKWTFHGSAKYP